MALIRSYAMDLDGSTVADYSGNSQDGTNTGAEETTGKYGDALLFSGTSDYVSVPNLQSELDGETGATVMCWVYVETGCSKKARLLRQGASDAYGDSEFDLSFFHGSNTKYFPRFMVRFGAGYGAQEALAQSEPGAEISEETWTHVAATFESGNPDSYMRIYVHGSLQYTKTRFADATLGILNNNADIGEPPYTSESVNVRIDELKLFDTALSESEIQAEMYLPILGPHIGSLMTVGVGR